MVGGRGPSLRRGRSPADSARDTVRAAAALSQSLRLSRDDGGHHPAALGREDITAFANRMAHQQRTGEMTPKTPAGSPGRAACPTRC